MSVSDMFWAAPPVSRTITAAAVLLSVPVWTGFVSPSLVVFLKYRVFTFTSLPQLWRLITPFFLTGPKLGLLLDPYFLFTYGKSLETEGARFVRPGDFFVYLVFVACMILVSDPQVDVSLVPPLYTTTTSKYLPVQPHTSCNGSWNRGRLPPVLRRRSSFANPYYRASVECRHGGPPQ
nr:hypothetical protein CFP56_34830 [Quercus suber]